MKFFRGRTFSYFIPDNISLSIWYCSVLNNVIIFIHYMFQFIHWYDIVQVCSYSSTFMILFCVEQCNYIYPLYVSIHPLIWYCSGVFIFIHIYDIVQYWAMCSYLSIICYYSSIDMILFRFVHIHPHLWYCSVLSNVLIFIQYYDIVHCWTMYQYKFIKFIFFTVEQCINISSSIWYYSLLNNVLI